MPNGATRTRRAEVVGAGFAGLAAAAALAARGWRVRVRERGGRLRAEGAGIYVYENGLRVLDALGALDGAVRGASLIRTREVRDGRGRVVSTHDWSASGRVYSVNRQTLVDALAAAAERAGAEIVTGSEGVGATPDGRLALRGGGVAAADLVVAADGVNSAIRDGLGLLAKRRAMPDGAVRAMVGKGAEERAAGDTGTAIEHWSGSRRVLHTPCSETEVYLALTMLDGDRPAKATPVDAALWRGSFPHLGDVFDRIGDRGRYDRFELVRLKAWSSGRVAVVGDAAHAMPPNLGQGGGCAMMNALALAVHLDRTPDVGAALAAWERAERPLTEHTQRMSVFFGLPATWPPPVQRLFFAATGRSRWIGAMRARTARHRPTGTC